MDETEARRRASLYTWFRPPHGLAHVYQIKKNGTIAETSGCGVDRLAYDKRGYGKRQKCDSCVRATAGWAATM